MQQEGSSFWSRSIRIDLAKYLYVAHDSKIYQNVNFLEKKLNYIRDEAFIYKKDLQINVKNEHI